MCFHPRVPTIKTLPLTHSLLLLLANWLENRRSMLRSAKRAARRYIRRSMCRSARRSRMLSRLWGWIRRVNKNAKAFRHPRYKPQRGLKRRKQVNSETHVAIAIFFFNVLVANPLLFQCVREHNDNVWLVG